MRVRVTFRVMFTFFLVFIIGHLDNFYDMTLDKGHFSTQTSYSLHACLRIWGRDVLLPSGFVRSGMSYFFCVNSNYIQLFFIP